jgi:hypothetical protein
VGEARVRRGQRPLHGGGALATADKDYMLIVVQNPNADDSGAA